MTDKPTDNEDNVSDVDDWLAHLAGRRSGGDALDDALRDSIQRLHQAGLSKPDDALGWQRMRKRLEAEGLLDPLSGAAPTDTTAYPTATQQETPSRYAWPSVGIAASAVLAVLLLWQMQPLPEQDMLAESAPVLKDEAPARASAQLATAPASPMPAPASEPPRKASMAARQDSMAAPAESRESIASKDAATEPLGASRKRFELAERSSAATLSKQQASGAAADSDQSSRRQSRDSQKSTLLPYPIADARASQLRRDIEADNELELRSGRSQERADEQEYGQSIERTNESTLESTAQSNAEWSVAWQSEAARQRLLIRLRADSASITLPDESPAIIRFSVTADR